MLFRDLPAYVCAVTASALVLTLVGAGCSRGDSDGGEPGSAPAIVRVTPQPTGVDEPTPAPEGTVVNQYDLEINACFNRYQIPSEQTDEVSDITTVVDCRRPHDGEVFATYFHPAGSGAPFPGASDMERWANLSCYQGFAEFVGVEYERSELEIGTIRPTEETWTGEGLHREVICYLFAPDAQLSGPMKGSRF